MLSGETFTFFDPLFVFLVSLLADALQQLRADPFRIAYGGHPHFVGRIGTHLNAVKPSLLLFFLKTLECGNKPLVVAFFPGLIQFLLQSHYTIPNSCCTSA